MTDSAFGGDEQAAFDEYATEADEVYAELLVRIGEAAPQPRLEPTRRACELLGDPQRSAPVIHITGTNGKTSTSRMIEAILRAQVIGRKADHDRPRSAAALISPGVAPW